ncbi:MAG: DNA polymerase I, partial [Deltaproteobacteria bacterium]|nr:DNA polymerase I [Deltaproteobacteria bacterium]
PRIVLEHRTLAKLKSTYLDALPQAIDPATGRIHTRFHAMGAATGRLSSSDPNLQNIPIRTALGRKIRAAFVAPPGCRIVSADYSQIELRVLAHLSGDPVLCAAFRNGEDIHVRTAKLVFGVDDEGVTSELRRRAKAINFGVVYGQGDFGLAQVLDISRREAGAFIEAYFERYAGVARYMSEAVESARRLGFSKTILGRKRWVPDLRSNNRQARMAAERVARNTPIQGTAADILKVAMVRLAERMDARALRSRMILTVHDELVLECPKDEVSEAKALLRETMESAAELSVPLVVDVGEGDTWGEAK